MRLYILAEGLMRIVGLRVQKSLGRLFKGIRSFREVVGEAVSLVENELRMSENKMSLVENKMSLVFGGMSLVFGGGSIILRPSNIKGCAALLECTAKRSTVHIIYILYNNINILSIVYLYLYLLYIY